MTDPVDPVLQEGTQLHRTLVGRAEEASGHACDERITVKAQGGRLTAIELDPRVLRLTNADLADAILTAANSALEGGADAPPAPDLDALLGSLREAQQLGHEWLDRAAEGMQRSVDQVTAISAQHRDRLPFGD